MELGKYVAELRKDRGLTQEQMETLSGIDRNYLASLETGRMKKPSTPVLLNLARAFRIKPEELYIAAGYIKSEPKSKKDTMVDLVRSIKADINRLEKMVNFTEHLVVRSSIIEADNYSPHNIMLVDFVFYSCLNITRSKENESYNLQAN